MNDFIHFVQEYWFQLSAALAFILECLFIFIKRKPKSIDDFRLAFDEALSLVPEFVSKVERPGEGSAKKAEVIAYAVKLIESRLKRHLTDNEILLVIESITNKIEIVLTTPMKKEINNEK